MTPIQLTDLRRIALVPYLTPVGDQSDKQRAEYQLVSESDLLSVLTDEALIGRLEDQGYRVLLQSDIAKWTYCPVCGNWAGDPHEPKPDGLEWCSPGRCPAWGVVAKFDHATREWVPVSRGGS